MRFRVNGVETYASTGGREHAAGDQCLVFIHGAGSNHTIWLQQSRALAYDGYNVLAPDLPGHGLSSGEPINGIGKMALWILDALTAAGCEEAVLVVHSMGGLVAIEAANCAPHRVKGIVFVGSGAEIPVSSRLVETARKSEHDAMDAMMSWAHGPDASLHADNWPGKSQVYFGIEMMRGNRPGALATDLQSCNEYREGLAHAAEIECPTLCILSPIDRMVSHENGAALARTLPKNSTVVLDGFGHMLPTECPGRVTAEIRRLLSDPATGILAQTSEATG